MLQDVWPVFAGCRFEPRHTKTNWLYLLQNRTILGPYYIKALYRGHFLRSEIGRKNIVEMGEKSWSRACSPFPRIFLFKIILFRSRDCVLENLINLGPYSPTILQNILGRVLKVFLYLATFIGNTSSDWLNRTVYPIRTCVTFKFTKS